MPYPNYNQNSEMTDEKLMAYDLRQRRAKIVGDHMEDVAFARKQYNYQLYFKAIQHLYIIVRHKISKYETPELNYKKLVQKLSNDANKYMHVWNGEGSDPNEVAIIENDLMEIEMFIYDKMEESDMFGSKWEDDEGL